MLLGPLVNYLFTYLPSGALAWACGWAPGNSHSIEKCNGVRPIVEDEHVAIVPVVVVVAVTENVCSPECIW